MHKDHLKTIPHYLLPKKTLTFLIGCLANVKNPLIKDNFIRHFIRAYQVNMAEALIEDPRAYVCFNDFFIRHLKPDSRTKAQATLISPADGFVSQLGPIHEGQIFQAKGRYYSVNELLGSAALAHQFMNGQFATIYLSPKDYHRVHMPIDATFRSLTYIPGALFSVQPVTTRMIPNLFARNERAVMLFDTAIGPMCMVMVGATIVGTIGTRWHGDLKRSKKPIEIKADPAQAQIRQGEEMGYFKLGSTVIILFAEGERVNWNKELVAGSVLRLGEAISSY